MRLVFTAALTALCLQTASNAEAGLSTELCPEADAAHRIQDDNQVVSAIASCLKQGVRTPAWLTAQVERVGLIALRSSALEEAELLFRAIEKRSADPQVVAALEHWRAALSDVQRYGAKNAEVLPADKLYQDGTEQFLKAFKMHKEGLEDEALPELQAAAGLLLPFLMRYQDDPRAARALLMMGVIKRASWLPGDDRAAFAYLQAAINSAPNSEISENAWRYLGEQVREIAETSKSGRVPAHFGPTLLRLKDRVPAS